MTDGSITAGTEKGSKEAEEQEEIVDAMIWEGRR